MMKDSKYYKQVQLLLRCLPEVNKEVCFALKGGTAINLFIKDLPRLSVDIDLAFLPLDPWSEAIELFEMEISTNILSAADLYGGKLVAALDRQHPRDLFDTKLLFESEGITDKIRKAFIVYLASHARPLHEVIVPTLLDKKNEFEKEFIGMTEIPFSYDDYSSTRDHLIKTLSADMTEDERNFLIFIQEGEPKWELLNIPDIEKLPALKWKVQNVQKMDKLKRIEQINDLRKKLNL